MNAVDRKFSQCCFPIKTKHANYFVRTHGMYMQTYTNFLLIKMKIRLREKFTSGIIILPAKVSRSTIFILRVTYLVHNFMLATERVYIPFVLINCKEISKTHN